MMLVAGLIGGGLVFAWERIGGDQERSLANAMAERDAALDEVATLSDRVDGFQARLTAARARTTALEGEVSAAQQEFLAMLGPSLPDGKHFGRLYAVGATQEPHPRRASSVCAGSECSSTPSRDTPPAVLPVSDHREGRTDRCDRGAVHPVVAH